MVVWEKAVDRQLEKTPEQVREKFQAWATLVSLAGIRDVRRQPGTAQRATAGPTVNSAQPRLPGDLR